MGHPPQTVPALQSSETRLQVAQTSPQNAIIAFKELKPRRKAADDKSIIIKLKRQHLGFESLEDMYGFESYLSFVIRGIDLLRIHSLKSSGCACEATDDAFVSIK